MKKIQILIIAFLIALSFCACASMQVRAASNLSQFVFSSIGSPQTAGTAFSITVTAEDSSGKTVTSYTGTNTLTVSSGTISPTSTTAFTSGVWTGQVTLSQAGTGISISTSGGGKSGKSNTLTVNSAALDHFAVNAVSSPQTAGKAFSVTITAKDSDGNTVTSYTGANTLTVSSGSISPTSTSKFVAGVWTGSVSLSASGSGITVGTSGSSKSGTSNSFTVNAGALDHFVFSNIGTQTVGTAFIVTFTAEDSSGNTVTSYNGPNTLTVSSGTISPTSTGTFSMGVWMGYVTLSASGSGITVGTSGSSKSGTSNSFTVNAAALDHFVFSSIGSPQNAGSAFSITITAKASNGNTVTSYAGTPTLSVSTGTISPTIAGTFSSGVWTGMVTMTGAGSGVTITATDNTHSGTSNSLTINPGVATQLAVSSGASQVAGIAFSVSVTAKDAYNNTATGYTGTVAITSTDNLAVLPANMVLTNGVGSFTITLETAGSQSITAMDTKTSSITGSQTSITVTHASAVANVAISPVGSLVTAGLSKTYLATASDLYGNSWDVTSATSWNISSGAGGSWSGNVYTSATAGSWTVTGTYASKAYTTSLTVNPAALDHFVFNTVATQTTGSAFNITVTAEDASGNTVISYGGTPSLTVSSGTISPGTMNAFVDGVGATSVTLTVAGSSITLTSTDGVHSGTSNSFTVNPTIFASAGAYGAISPNGIISVNYGSSQSFTMTPSSGYQIADVVADNVSLGAISYYTFTDVQAAHTITVNFTIDTFNITTSAGGGGSISPNGSVSVNYGDDQTFTIIPNAGYYIVDVLVNGSSVGPVSSYTLTSVEASNTISATFAPTSTPSPFLTATPPSAPTQTRKPITSPSPKPTSSPTPTPSATTVPATTDSDATVDLFIRGNVTSSQLSDASITSLLSSKTTTLSFTLTGPNGAAGFCNMTIPKTAVSYGNSPVVYIEGQKATSQGYTQDANNFYVWYTARFDTNLVNGVSQVTVQFLVPSISPAKSIGVALAIGIIVPEIILIYTVIAVRRLRRKPDDP
jgi:hypothetical protein